MTPPEEIGSTDPGAETIWSRGGLWVVAQFPLGGAAALAAMVGPRLPESGRPVAWWIGLAVLVSGGLLFLMGVRHLGRNLTPFPKPKADARLVDTGAYRLVRHPLYGGAILLMLGWALLNGRWTGLVGTLVLTIFFDRKASVEEGWLTAQFTGYRAYRQRTRKLIPWLY
jgi:protein-S-isoprenylcysteine O-methyltransferase Ste14